MNSRNIDSITDQRPSDISILSHLDGNVSQSSVWLCLISFKLCLIGRIMGAYLRNMTAKNHPCMKFFSVILPTEKVTMFR